MRVMVDVLLHRAVKFNDGHGDETPKQVSRFNCRPVQLYEWLQINVMTTHWSCSTMFSFTVTVPVETVLKPNLLIRFP